MVVKSFQILKTSQRLSQPLPRNSNSTARLALLRPFRAKEDAGGNAWRSAEYPNAHKYAAEFFVVLRKVGTDRVNVDEGSRLASKVIGGLERNFEVVLQWSEGGNEFLSCSYRQLAVTGNKMRKKHSRLL